MASMSTVKLTPYPVSRRLITLATGVTVRNNKCRWFGIKTDAKL